MLHKSIKYSNYFRFFTLVISIFLLTVIFFHTDNAITQDLGRHLTLGKIIHQEKKIPEVNLFSYTYPNFPFINHHWGSEVIFYEIYRYFNINGLIIAKVILVITAFILLTRYAFVKSNSLSCLISVLITAEILRERTDIRPEIFGYFLFSLILIIIYREKEKPGKLILILPLLTLLWVNLHISFIYVLLIWACFLIDRLFNKKLKKIYILILALLILSTFINPFGIKGALFPLVIFRNYGYSIVENQSPFFLEKLMKDPTIIYFKLAVILFFLVSPVLLLKKYYFEVLLALSTAVLSFNAIRHFPFFALSFFIPLALGIKILQDKLDSLRRVKKLVKLGNLTIAILIIGLILFESYNFLSNRFYISHYQAVRTGLGSVAGMKDSVDFFQQKNIEGPIFNNFDIGSYLIFRLYPQERVFVDGRPEAYPASFFQSVYIPMQESQVIWEEQDRKYNFQSIVFSITDITPWARQFLTRILNDKKWGIVFFDDFGVILVKSTGKSTELIYPQEKIKQRAIMLLKTQKTPDGILRLANLYSLLGYTDLITTAQFKAENLIE